MKPKGCRNKKRIKVLTLGGYYDIYEPSHPVSKSNGYALEHRVIAYNAGLLTDLSMEVHHINGIKTDNRLSNLKVLTKQEHTSITWKGVKRSDNGTECKMCNTKTRSKYNLCQKHYKLEWQRRNIYENPELLNQKT